MKLCRYGPKGQEKPGIIDADGRIRDLSSIVGDITANEVRLSQLVKLKTADLNALPVVEGQPRYGVPVANIGKIIAVGLNYADHAAESNLPVPDEPVLFMKATSAIVGPNDEVLKPRGSTKLDWEVELGLVIGKKASYVSEAEALDYVAGFCTINDVSERNFQTERGGTWDKGKGCDTFGPIGPWLVTKDEAGDVNNLKMWLDVNGKRFQNGTTSTMVFKPAFLVHYVSQFMSLHPGDVISTGTPPGVGLGQKPDPIYLNVGDVMELGIEGLGTQKQTVGAA